MSDPNTIYKFPLSIVGRQVVEMPVGAEVLCAQVQAGELCLWATVHAEVEVEPRAFWVIGTGNVLPDRLGRYVGTVLMPPFVWHVFEETTDA